MRKLLDDCVAEIKAALPNSLISWDISFWLTYSAMKKWWGYFKNATYIDFLHTSGGIVLLKNFVLFFNKFSFFAYKKKLVKRIKCFYCAWHILRVKMERSLPNDWQKNNR